MVLRLTDICTALLIHAAVADAVGYGSPPNQQFVYTGKAPISPGIAEYDVDLTKLYKKTGLTKEGAGRTCAELRSMGMTDSGLYWIKPDTYDLPYQAYCDMKSFGGGWQMCYTSQYSSVHLTNDSELVYNASLPYRTDGYRSNCKNVPFNQVIYVLHIEPKCFDRFNKKCKNTDKAVDEDEKAYFTYETTEGESLVSFVIAGNSGRNLVTPTVQLMYSKLNEMKRQYAVQGRTPTNNRGDQQLPDSLDRAAFSGSVPTAGEAEGLFENYARRLDIRGRATDFWRGRGVAYKVSDAGVVSPTDNWKYQLIICDERSAVPVGLFMSGIDADAAGCFKTCSDWCGDATTDHYRASWGDRFCNASRADGERCIGAGPDLEPSDVGPGRSAGSAFRQNGYAHTTFKPISVGIRYRV
jgi:hypothetical protein